MMRTTIRILATLAGLFLCLTVVADEAADGPVLTAMLQAFLVGASQNDAQAHDRFWSEKLVYTSSAGKRFGKADIMDGLEKADTGEEPATVYSAEDIRIQQYGSTAIVAFRLVATPLTAEDGVVEFFNTGTFVREKVGWRVVAWQATKIPAD